LILLNFFLIQLSRIPIAKPIWIGFTILFLFSFLCIIVIGHVLKTEECVIYDKSRIILQGYLNNTAALRRIPNAKTKLLESLQRTTSQYHNDVTSIVMAGNDCSLLKQITEYYVHAIYNNSLCARKCFHVLTTPQEREDDLKNEIAKTLKRCRRTIFQVNACRKNFKPNIGLFKRLFDSAPVNLELNGERLSPKDSVFMFITDQFNVTRNPEFDYEYLVKNEMVRSWGNDLSTLFTKIIPFYEQDNIVC